jgi:hypothetical protein
VEQGEGSLRRIAMRFLVSRTGHEKHT